MPWTTPTLQQVRAMTRDGVAGALATASIPKDVILASLNRAASVGNSVLRVMSDSMSMLAHLCLKYLDWLALQFLPDTAETEWLDRHGDIWLVNADNSVGRKVASFAHGQVAVTGTSGTVLPQYSQLSDSQSLLYETVDIVTISGTSSLVNVRALTAGSASNLKLGDALTFAPPITNVNGAATATVDFQGGVDTETDDQLRMRVLLRIRNPPMGGDATDYVQWALAVPGVTRAWCGPNEMGIGTVTVRFMMDVVRADNYGIPTDADVAVVKAYLDTKRPVAVKDFFVLAPIPYPLDMAVTDLDGDTASTRTAISNAVTQILLERGAPGATVYRSWIDEAISGVIGEDHHELTFDTVTPPTGSLPVLGVINYP